MADRVLQPALQQEELKELGISEDEIRQSLEQADTPLGWKTKVNGQIRSLRGIV